MAGSTVGRPVRSCALRVAVLALLPSASTVYVGRDFTTIGGQARNRIAALDNAGVASGWNPGAGGRVSALALSGSTVFAGGSFASIGRQPRQNIAALGSTGAATAWDAHANDRVFAVAVDR